MPTVQTALTAVGVFSLFVIAGFVVRAALAGWALPWAQRRELPLVYAALDGMRAHVLLWLGLAGLVAAAETLTLPERVRSFLDPALGVMLVVSLTLFVLALVGSAFRIYGERSESFRPVAGIGERLSQIIVVVLGGLMLLSYLPVDVRPLLTGLGVAGLATALALQDTLANFFAGLYVLADRPVQVGQYARLNDANVEGYVISVGWRSTRIRTLANNVVVVPNQKLAQSVVTNYHLPEQKVVANILVRVALECDPERVLAVLEEEACRAVGEVEGLLLEPTPVARFNPGLGENGWELTVTCHAREFADQYWVQHELRRRLFARLRREGIAIPYPTRTVHLAAAAEVADEQTSS
ncbi:MAG: mechanosensitive ion channel family protein [Chloroflexota bacterium]